MKLCPDCGGPGHPKWKAHVFVNTRKVRLVNTDRHAPGYMRMYMAVRRAVVAGKAERWPKCN